LCNEERERYSVQTIDHLLHKHFSGIFILDTRKPAPMNGMSQKGRFKGSRTCLVTWIHPSKSAVDAPSQLALERIAALVTPKLLWIL
jgi:hypothetical protein